MVCVMLGFTWLYNTHTHFHFDKQSFYFAFVDSASVTALGRMSFSMRNNKQVDEPFSFFLSKE